MTAKLNAGEIVRQEVFLIDPENIVVDEKLNGRWQPHSDEEVEALCKSLEEEGQLQPVQVRRIAGNRVQLVLGYRRHKAMLRYNRLHPGNPRKLKCTLGDMNEEEAFRYNIVENRERKDTSPVDDAHNQRRLREDFGWSDIKISELYKMAPSYVSVLKKLLSLPMEIQEMVHRKLLAAQAAIAISDLPPAEQKDVVTSPEDKVDGSQDPSIPVPTSEVIKRVREKKIQCGKKQPRTLKEVKDFFEGLTGAGKAARLRNLATTILQFIQGEITDKTMINNINLLFSKKK